MTPQQKVRHLWPEAWCRQSPRGEWQIFRHSMRDIQLLGTGTSPQAAWKDAAKDL